MRWRLSATLAETECRKIQDFTWKYKIAPKHEIKDIRESAKPPTTESFIRAVFETLCT